LTSAQPVPLHVPAAGSASTPSEVTDVNVSKVFFVFADAAAEQFAYYERMSVLILLFSLQRILSTPTISNSIFSPKVIQKKKIKQELMKQGYYKI